MVGIGGVDRERAKICIDALGLAGWAWRVKRDNNLLVPLTGMTVTFGYYVSGEWISSADACSQDVRKYTLSTEVPNGECVFFRCSGDGWDQRRGCRVRSPKRAAMAE